MINIFCYGDVKVENPTILITWKTLQRCIETEKEDIYFGCGLRPKDLGIYKKGTADEISAIPGFWVDIDIQDENAHKKKNYPPTLDDALSLVKGHGWDPTLIVHTGHGLHAYWLFKENWVFDTDEERLEAAELHKRLHHTILARAEKHGLTIDNVSNLDRILRPPGTINCKTKEKIETKILEYNENLRYNPSQMEEFFIDLRNLPEIDTDPITVSSNKPTESSLTLDPNADVPTDFLEALLENDPLFKRTWNKQRDDELRSPSEYDLSIASRILYAGASEQDAANLIFEFRRKHGLDVSKALRDDYMARTLEKARDSQNDAGQELIEKAKSSNDISLIYKNIDLLAKLNKTVLSRMSKDLKNHFGNNFNKKDFNSEIKQAKAIYRKKVTLSKYQNNNLPKIMVNDKQHRELVDETISALKTKNDPPNIFMRSGKLVRVIKDEYGKPIINEFNESSIRHEISKSADFFSETNLSTRVTSPSKELCLSVLNVGEWPFPPLKGITEVPLIRSDGSILDSPGYDKETQMVYCPDKNLKIPDIPDKPTCDDAKSAAQYIIEELLYDFPFVDYMSKANAIGTLLSPITRKMINSSVPIGIIDATVNGTAKSMFCDVVSIIATGRPGAMLKAPDREDEFGKLLVSALLEGSSMIIFDNVEKRLSSPCLARVLTAKIFSGRKLSFNKTIELPVESIFLGNGNNISLGGDIPRRAYWVRMDPKSSKPWLRDGFKHPNLRDWVKENRVELLVKLLIMIRAWVVAGRPKGDVPRLGSFEDWAETIGGILKFASVKGFLENFEQMHDRSDEESPELEAFLSKWYEMYGNSPKLVSEIGESLVAGQGTNELSAFGETLPTDLLIEFEKYQQNSFNRKLGIAFKKIEGRRFGDDEYCLKRSNEKESRSGAAKWYVRKYKKIALAA